MIICSLILFTLTLSTTVYAKLNATALNSPVKEAYLKVKLEGFPSVSEVYFKPKNGGNEIQGDVAKEGTTYIGKFRASYLKPGAYEYRLKIRTTSGASPKDEAASVTFVKFSIDKSLEVADPGEEGKKTLAGIDTDGAVRDDVQRWINEEYPMEKFPSTNSALKQYSSAEELALINSKVKDKAVFYSDKALEAFSCLMWIKGTRPGHQISKHIDLQIHNTEERIRAHFVVESYLRGTSRPDAIIKVGDDKNKLCNFQASKEE